MNTTGNHGKEKRITDSTDFTDMTQKRQDGMPGRR
jgi:hypothetical protein